MSVLLRWFDPTAFLELMEEHQLQFSAVVPTMLQILLSNPLEDYDLSALAYLTSGGARWPGRSRRSFDAGCHRFRSVRAMA